MRFKCNSCGGTYADTQADGTRYFHACSPVVNPAFQPDPTKLTHDARETIERDNARNENMKPGLAFQDGKYVVVTADLNDAQKTVATEQKQITRSEGAGRTPSV
jgi:ssDNA-binding Zn-finger/Zn-ribbon topoisomerase 1